MQDLGWTDAPCVVVQLDKTQEKALNLALNKITGQWDERMLAELLQDIQSSDIDTAVTGFEPPEIEQLFQKVFPQTAQEDHYNPDAELQQPCCSRPGDLWHLGVHQVFCGDATTQAPYAALLPDTSADLILTDPPYNVNVTETAGRHGVGVGGRAGQHEFDFLAGFDLVAAHDGHASSVIRISGRRSRMLGSTCPAAVSG